MLHAREDYNRRIQDSENIIPDDEPVFLLRANDGCAVEAVRAWIRAAVGIGVKGNMVQAAREQLNRFMAWEEEHGTKVPDMD